MERNGQKLPRLRAGDVYALEACYREHGAQVYRLCLQILGQPADAEDATQEVFLKLLDRGYQFEGRARFTTWLWRLTMNLCLHRIERECVRRATPLHSEDVPAPVDESTSPFDRAAARDEAARLAHVLSCLPVEHRIVLHLREVEGLAYREIAQVLSVPMGTVMSRIARAREGLARWIHFDEPNGSPSITLSRSLS